MKKIVPIVVAALAMCLCLAFLPACSSQPSPSEVTKSALDAFKAQDTETLAKYYSGNVEDMTSQIEAAANSNGEEASDAQSALESTMMQKMLDFDYTLGEETIEGDTATVGVSLTTYDMGTALGNALTNYISNAFAAAFSGAGQDELEDMFYQELQSELEALTDKSYTADFDVTLTKGESGWMLDAFSDEATNAFSGGMMDAANSVSESLSGMTE